MAFTWAISRDTFAAFAKSKRYDKVILGQGVPVLDADFNEAQDIRRAQEQAFERFGLGYGLPLALAGTVFPDVVSATGVFTLQVSQDTYLFVGKPHVSAAGGVGGRALFLNTDVTEDVAGSPVTLNMADTTVYLALAVRHSEADTTWIVGDNTVDPTRFHGAISIPLPSMADSGVESSRRIKVEIGLYISTTPPADADSTWEYYLLGVATNATPGSGHSWTVENQIPTFKALAVHETDLAAHANVIDAHKNESVPHPNLEVAGPFVLAPTGPTRNLGTEEYIIKAAVADEYVFTVGADASNNVRLTGAQQNPAGVTWTHTLVETMSVFPFGLQTGRQADIIAIPSVGVFAVWYAAPDVYFQGVTFDGTLMSASAIKIMDGQDAAGPRIIRDSLGKFTVSSVGATDGKVYVVTFTYGGGPSVLFQEVGQDELNPRLIVTRAEGATTTNVALIVNLDDSRDICCIDSGGGGHQVQRFHYYAVGLAWTVDTVSIDIQLDTVPLKVYRGLEVKGDPSALYYLVNSDGYFPLFNKELIAWRYDRTVQTNLGISIPTQSWGKIYLVDFFVKSEMLLGVAIGSEKVAPAVTDAGHVLFFHVPAGFLSNAITRVLSNSQFHGASDGAKPYWISGASCDFENETAAFVIGGHDPGIGFDSIVKVGFHRLTSEISAHQSVAISRTALLQSIEVVL